MEATKQHEVWQSQCLDPSLETLLEAYVRSVGSEDVGAPAELVAGAARIASQHATVHAAGPADCTEQFLQKCRFDLPHDNDDKSTRDGTDEDEGEDMVDDGNECAAALDGGVDDLKPVELWDTIMKNIK